MKIADGVEMLEITAEIMGRRMVIHPTLMYDDQSAVLVDTGMPGQLDAFRSALDHAGVPFERLTAVILTHQDIDHIGGIQDILAAVGKPVEVCAHPADQPYIEGEKRPIKLNPERFAQVLSQLPEEARRNLQHVLEHPPAAKVTRPVKDGEVFSWAGGIQIVYTPGHTPGHISLYHIPSKTLVVGDATVAENGKLLGPNPSATPDMPQALASLRKLAALDGQRVICYHGGLCESNVTEQLRELAK